MREKSAADLEMAQMSRRSFAWGAVSVVATVSGLGWISGRPRDPMTPGVKGIPGPLRQVLDANGRLWEGLSSSERLVEQYPPSAVKPIRTNGSIGLDTEVDSSTFSIAVEGLRERVNVPIQDIMALPRVELRTKFKCIEGWSSVVQAAGCRFADFWALVRERTGTAGTHQHAYLATPDGQYYVALEKKALLHPQTLLAWEMNSEPLRPENGAPLRLFIPVKYGIKNLKRVGLVRFQDERPTDYWYERGYDWHAGL